MAYFGWMPSITADMWNKTINEELNIVFLALSRSVGTPRVKKQRIDNKHRIC